MRGAVSKKRSVGAGRFVKRRGLPQPNSVIRWPPRKNGRGTNGSIPAIIPAIIAPMPKRPFYTNLYFQVLVAIAIGVVMGIVAPDKAAAMKPLGDGFIKLVKMLIAPIVFTTVVVGIAHMGEMRDVGRIGLRALIYFEVVSTVALLIGLVVVTVLQPGVGVGFDPATADTSSVAAYTTASQHLSTVDFVLNVIPDTIEIGRAHV